MTSGYRLAILIGVGTEEVLIRKVIATELVSLDGVMEAPEKWSLQYHSDEMAEADAMLFGRVTYQEFASYWPYQNSAEQPFTDYLCNTPKFVSTTLEELLLASRPSKGE